MNHASYILTAYLVAGVTVGGTILRIVTRHRALRRALTKYGPREAHEA